jgi:hypothetical protein
VNNANDLKFNDSKLIFSQVSSLFAGFTLKKTQTANTKTSILVPNKANFVFKNYFSRFICGFCVCKYSNREYRGPLLPVIKNLLANPMFTGTI